MKTQKAGCILVNMETKKIGLVYRKKLNDYSFPKGHLEEGETILECAVRETEEETGRKNHIVLDMPSYTLEYTTPRGEDVENHMFISIDEGETDKEIPLELKESLVWIDCKNVAKKLSYPDLIEMWNYFELYVYKLLNK